MRVRQWCDRCRFTIGDGCKCTPAELQRHGKLKRLEELKQEVATLSRELGLGAGESGNRHERRTTKAQRRGGL